ncbi:MAG: Gfo/Idh/MocA family protein [Planctomycetota bacterium]
MGRMNRREFLNTSVRGAAGISMGMAALSLPSSRALGANERINVALIGCGGRGSINARTMIECGAEINYLCDLNDERLAKAAKFLADVQQRKPKHLKNMRKVFDSKDVDAVIIATPDHWHTPASILACQAGKDAYVEKPHSHNIWEGRKLIEAARKYDRIVQVGVQNRSGAYNQAALEYLKSGKLGGIRLVKVYNLKPGRPFKLGDAGKRPANFDWDQWLGAAQDRPYHQRIFNRGWHQFWDYSGGDMANDGIHQLDLALMLLGDPGMPTGVSCTAGRLQHKGDDSEVPDVQVVSYEFGDFLMTFELTNYPRYMLKTTGTIRQNKEFPYWTQNATRIEFYGSELMMTLGRHGGGWQVTTSGGKVVEQMYGRPCDAEHAENFLQCVKNRQRPKGDIEIMHTSCTMVHMANIAHRVGNRKLRFDSKTERFIDSDEANSLIKRHYRKKYEVPEQV